MAAYTTLCEVCRVTIEFDYKLMAWRDCYGFTYSNNPAHHEHYSHSDKPKNTNGGWFK